MKKLLFLIVSVLAVCAAAFAGCSGNKSNSDGSLIRERIQNLVEEQTDEETDCEDGECEDKTEYKIPDVHINPVPRSSRKRGNQRAITRDIDIDAEGEEDEEIPEENRPCPHKRHKRHKDAPAPRPEHGRLKPRN